jgi:hypothetical protein
VKFRAKTHAFLGTLGAHPDLTMRVPHETTLLAVLILATGCAGSPGSTDPKDGDEQALKTSTSSDRIVGTYKGPRATLTEERIGRYSPENEPQWGSVFLQVTKKADEMCRGAEYVVNVTLRLDSGEVYDAQSFVAKVQGGNLVFYSSSSDGCDAADDPSLEILPNGDLKTRIQLRISLNYRDNMVEIGDVFKKTE